MSCSEGLGLAFKGFCSEIKGILKPKNEFDKPLANMTSHDSLSLSTQSTSSETKGLLGKTQKSEKRFKVPTAFSTHIETIKGKLNKTFFSSKEAKYSKLEDSGTNAEKSSLGRSSGNVLADPEALLDKTGQVFQDDFHTMRDNGDKLKDIHESKTLSRSDKKQAEKLSERSKILEREHKSLTHEQMRLANTKDFSKLKQFEENTQYHGSFVQKWNKDVEKLYAKNKTREHADLKKSEAKKAKYASAQAQESMQQHIKTLENDRIQFTKKLTELKAFHDSALKSQKNADGLISSKQLAQADEALKHAGIVHKVREDLILRPETKIKARQFSDLKYYDQDVETYKGLVKKWQAELDRIFNKTASSH